MKQPADQIKKAVEKAIKSLSPKGDFSFEIEHPNDLSNGDYSTNAAMKLAGQLKKNPFEIGEQIKSELSEDKSLNKIVEKIEVVKPGFINFYLSESFFQDAVTNILKEKDEYGKQDLGKGKTVMFEYSQMNVAKPIHVGHIRTMFLGDSLKRLYTFLGYNAISDTHYGDWGTQFGMVLYAYKQDPDAEKKVKENPIGELVRLYSEINNRLEDEPELREEAKAEFKKLEDGDKENLKLWKWFVDATVKAFEEIYKTLDILPFEHHLGESYYEDQMPPIVDELLKKKVATKEGEMVYVDLEDHKLGRCIMVKSDGATTYHLRDMATYKHRFKELKVNKNYYVVDSRQSHHFKQLFKVVELLGWKGVSETKHIDYGFVTLPEGSLSTRKGRIVTARDVIDQGVTKAKELIEEKNPDLKKKDKAALEVVRAAMKFANLVTTNESDIVFDWNTVLTFEGDSGPYLQYTYARIQSLLKKVKEKPVVSEVDLTEQEKELLQFVYRLPEQIKKAHDHNDPHYIATYLLDLAHRFNSFYGNVSVSSEEDKAKRQNRLAVSAATAQVLKSGLALLGINVLNEM